MTWALFTPMQYENMVFFSSVMSGFVATASWKKKKSFALLCTRTKLFIVYYLILAHPRPSSWEHDIGSLTSGKLTFQAATQRRQQSRSVVYMCSTSVSMRLRHGGDTVAFNPGSGIGRSKGPSGETVCSNSNLSVKSGPWEKKGHWFCISLLSRA